MADFHVQKPFLTYQIDSFGPCLLGRWRGLWRSLWCSWSRWHNWRCWSLCYWCRWGLWDCNGRSCWLGDRRDFNGRSGGGFWSSIVRWSGAAATSPILVLFLLVTSHPFTLLVAPRKVEMNTRTMPPKSAPHRAMIETTKRNSGVGLPRAASPLIHLSLVQIYDVLTYRRFEIFWKGWKQRPC